MSSRVISYSAITSSYIIPPANFPRMRSTGTRVPVMTGLPNRTLSLTLIRGAISMIDLLNMLPIGQNPIFLYTGRTIANLLQRVNPIKHPLERIVWPERLLSTLGYQTQVRRNVDGCCSED